MGAISQVLLGLYKASGGGGGPFYLDTFAGSAGTALSSHSANTGGAYTAVSGSGTEAKLSGSNSLLVYDTAGYYQYVLQSATPASADYVVTADIVVSGTASTGFGIGARATSTGTYGYFLIWWGGYSGFNLYKNVNTSLTLLGSYSSSLPSGSHTVAIEVNGTAITGFLDGQPIIAAHDSAITAAGHPEVYCYPGSGSPTDIVCSEIEGTSITAPALVAHGSAVAYVFPITLNTTGSTMIIVAQSYFTGYGGGGTPVDSVGGHSNTYIPLGSPAPYGSGGTSIQLYYCIPVYTGSGHTFSVTSNYNGLFVLTFSGIFTGVDVFGGNTSGSGPTLAAASSSLTPSETVSVAVTAVGSFGYQSTFTLDSSYLYPEQQISGGSGCSGAIGYKIFTSTPGAQNPNWTIGSAASMGTVLAIFY